MWWEIHDAKTTSRSYAQDWNRLVVELSQCRPFFDSRLIGARSAFLLAQAIEHANLALGRNGHIELGSFMPLSVASAAPAVPLVAKQKRTIVDVPAIQNVLHRIPPIGCPVDARAISE
jgi:hypothetical protein